MRKIVKGSPPADLRKFLTKEDPHHWEDIHDTKAYPELYAQCISQLKSEQGFLGGYTERPLPSEGIHVDHFRKQSLFPSQKYVFGWNNLIVDEHNISFGADHKDNAIRNVKDYERLIDPVAQDPHHFFTYIERGLIKPKEGLSAGEKEMAVFTISVFNLQHPLLCDDRREIIELVKVYRNGGLSEEEIQEQMCNLGYPSVVEYAFTLI